MNHFAILVLFSVLSLSLFTRTGASIYGFSATVNGNLNVGGKTILSNNIQIGSTSFPSSSPSAPSQVLTSSTPPSTLVWADPFESCPLIGTALGCVVSIGNATGSTGDTVNIATNSALSDAVNTVNIATNNDPTSVITLGNSNPASSINLNSESLVAPSRGFSFVSNSGNHVRLSIDPDEAVNITYLLPSTNPSANQVLSASAPSSGISNLSWATISQVSLSNASGSTGIPLLSGTSPDFFVAGLKGGAGITISDEIDGDVTINSTISQVSLFNASGSTGIPLLSGASPDYEIVGLKAGTGIVISDPANGDITLSSTLSPLCKVRDTPLNMIAIEFPDTDLGPIPVFSGRTYLIQWIVNVTVENNDDELSFSLQSESGPVTATECKFNAYSASVPESIYFFSSSGSLPFNQTVVLGGNSILTINAYCPITASGSLGLYWGFEDTVSILSGFMVSRVVG